MNEDSSASPFLASNKLYKSCVKARSQPIFKLFSILPTPMSDPFFNILHIHYHTFFRIFFLGNHNRIIVYQFIFQHYFFHFFYTSFLGILNLIPAHLLTLFFTFFKNIFTIIFLNKLSN